MSIVLVPNPVLTNPTKAVTAFDDTLNAIIANMEKTLRAASDPVGVGLAAPQIGIPLRIFAMRPKISLPVTFFINPRITNLSAQNYEYDNDKDPLEGCLSIPNTWGIVKRRKSLVLEWYTAGKKLKRRTFSNYPAIIVQHEMDHLDGILFTARVLEQSGKLFEVVRMKNGKTRLKKLPL